MEVKMEVKGEVKMGVKKDDSYTRAFSNGLTT